MGLKIGALIEQIKHWFPKAQAQLQAQANDLENKINHQSLNPLPHDKITYLSNRIDSLPTACSHRVAVQSKLQEAIAQWQEQEDAPNSLVVLGSPVEPIGKILNESLAEWEQQHLWLKKSLSWSTRPPHYSMIKSQLSEEIGLAQEVKPIHNNYKTTPLAAEPLREQVLMVIPDLSWCFLRCVDGLEGIEYLQDLLFNNRSLFWLIGCNDWAWNYLDAVCQLGTYFGEILSLPPLEDLELKEWLTPVSETIEFDFGDGQNNQNNDNSDMEKENEENWVSSAQQSYFEHLATICLGLTTVGARLWLLSLGIRKQEDESDHSDALESEDEVSQTIIQERATLPDLPKLTKDDLYILFSLCLHGGLSLSELALSLGDPENRVQDRVQVLCRSGVLIRSKNLLWVNPAHYPRLKRDLADNHLLI
jgi:hypothetical protein